MNVKLYSAKKIIFYSLWHSFEKETDYIFLKIDLNTHRWTTKGFVLRKTCFPPSLLFCKINSSICFTKLVLFFVKFDDILLFLFSILFVRHIHMRGRAYKYLYNKDDRYIVLFNEKRYITHYKNKDTKCEDIVQLIFETEKQLIKLLIRRILIF